LTSHIKVITSNFNTNFK